MKGTDINDAQMEAACEFVAFIGKQPIPDHDGDLIKIKFSTMVRLVAWYGAIRYQAGQRGIGQLDKPASIEELGSVQQEGEITR